MAVTPDALVVSGTERVDRVATLVVTLVPVVALVFGVTRAAGHGLGWSDVAAFLITYVLCGLGVTVGFHRLLTHRSFNPLRPSAASWRRWGRQRSRDR